MNDNDKGEQVKEVYARFGLALYHAQVLEHGLVNALVVLDLIPSSRHLARSKDEWGLQVDNFMDRQFEKTMGRMIAALRSVATVPEDLEALLRRALQKRNWLAHDFFRERATQFLDSAGREQMLAEVDECCEEFEAADRRLDEVVAPLRNAAGLTDEMLREAFEQLAQNERDG